MSLEEEVRAFRRKRMQESIDAAGGNMSKAAKALGMTRQNFHIACKRAGGVDMRPIRTDGWFALASQPVRGSLP